MTDGTINNDGCPAVGSITITKDTVGGDGTFDFTGDLGAFTITTSGETGTYTRTDLTPGTYVVTETAETGFDLTALACVDGSNDSTTDVDTATATIVLAAGVNSP
jgi:hypothetical protein